MALPDETDAIVRLTEAERNLWSLLDEFVSGMGYKLVDLELKSGGRGRTTLRVFISREGGVTLHDCELASREISAYLDAHDPIQGRYVLEVSSPGLTRTLKWRDHFVDEIGQMVAVVLHGAIDGKHKIVGTVKRVYDREGHVYVVIESEGHEYDVPLMKVAKAKKHFEI